MNELFSNASDVLQVCYRLTLRVGEKQKVFLLVFFLHDYIVFDIVKPTIPNPNNEQAKK